MLSPDQIAARRYRLGGSDIKCLMTGNAPEIMRLWQEKRGEVEPENLDHVLPVQIGSVTEPVNLRWYAMKSAITVTVTRQGEIVIHPKYRWAGVTLDGWDENLACPVECKHVGGREPLEIIIDRYQPQMQWQMECTNAKQCALSGIVGISEHVVEYIDRDPDYAAEMIKRGAQFWHCVEKGIPPVYLEPVAPPADRTRVVNMMETPAANQWGSAAFTWIEDKPAAERCDDAAKILKSLVPEDATKCFGAGVQVVLSRDGKKKYLREETA